MRKPSTYTNELWCGHCEKTTLQHVRDSGHERDSSGDSQECLVCRWTRCGMSWRWWPPTKDDKAESDQ